MAWEDEELHDIGLNIIVVEHLYTKEEIGETSEQFDYFKEELELELRSEIESSIGSIKKLEFFKENPNGVVKIKFNSALHAEECIKVMNGRFFDGRQLNAYFWDGKTDYRLIRESNEEVQKRIEEFG